MPVDPGSPVGQNLRELREAKDLTRIQVADELGVVERTVAKWEREESMPAYRYLEMLAKLYGTTVPRLFDPRP